MRANYVIFIIVNCYKKNITHKQIKGYNMKKILISLMLLPFSVGAMDLHQQYLDFHAQVNNATTVEEVQAAIQNINDFMTQFSVYFYQHMNDKRMFNNLRSRRAPYRIRRLQEQQGIIPAVQPVGAGELFPAPPTPMDEAEPMDT